MNPLTDVPDVAATVRGWWIVAERAGDWVAFNLAHLYQTAAHDPGALLSGQTWLPYSWHDWQQVPYAGILGRLGNGSPESVAASHILWWGHRGALVVAALVFLTRLKGYRALWLLVVGLLWLLWRIVSAPFRIGRGTPSRVTVEERDIAGGARWATGDELRGYRRRDDAMPLRLGRACGLDGKPHGPMLYLDKRRATQSVLMIAPPGCQPAGSRVLMADGTWKTVEDVGEGDMVMSPQHDGTVQPAHVLRTTGYDGAHIYRVTMRKRCGDGPSYLCSGDHILPHMALIRDGRYGPRRTELREMTVEDFLMRGKGYQEKARIFTTPAYDLPAKDFPIHPYVLGCFIGDGCMCNGASASFSTATPELIERMRAYGAELHKTYYEPKRNIWTVRAAGATRQAIVDSILWKRTSYTHRIPPEYMLGSLEQRRLLLAGLVDTDGTAQEFTSMSRGLAEDFKAVVFSCGGWATLNEHRIQLNGKCFTAWRVHYAVGEEPLPVTLAYKALPSRDMEWKNHRRATFEVEYVERARVYGFTLDGASQWYVTDNWIVTHNSGKSAFWISALLDIERTTRDSPSLFLWDVKGELAARTAAQLRRAGYATLELDPFGEKARVSPMVWLTSPRWIDVFMTAWLANTDSGVGGNSDDTHEGWSRQIITAAILALRSRHGDSATLPAVFKALDGDLKDVYALLCEADDEGTGAATWKRLMDGPDGTFLRQRHSLRTRGAAFTEPAVRRFVSGHDLSLDQLLTRQGKPLAVYYQIPSATQQLVLPLTAAIVALLFAKIAAYGNRRGLDRGLLALFDEAGSGAVIPSLPQGLDTLRGAGVAQVIVVQRLGQLVEKYGKVGAAGIKGSCGTWVTLGGIAPDDADEVLRRIGERLLREERTTVQRVGDDVEEGRLHSADKTKPLLTQVQLAQLPPSVHLVVPRDRPPLLTYNKPYWEDKRLRKRASADDGDTRKEGQPAKATQQTQAQQPATAIRDYY